MGSETFYCARCASRLSGADVRRVGNELYCAGCAPAGASAATPPATRPASRTLASAPRHPRPPAPEAPKASAVPWIVGGIAIGLVVLAIVIGTASRSAPPAPPPLPRPPAPRAEAPAPPRPPAPPAPRAETPSIPRPPAVSASEFERLEDTVSALVKRDGFAEAERLCVEASGWRSDEAGMRRILALRTRVRSAARDRLAAELAGASAARLRRDEPAVAAARERVVAWGIRELAVDFDRGLPRIPEAPWRVLIDGVAGLGGGSDDSWKMVDGALERLPEGKNAAQSRARFADAELRIRFEGVGDLTARFWVRQGGEGMSGVTLRAPEGLGAHELIFVCKGDEVKATLDGRPLTVETHGMPKEGHLQFNNAGGKLRVLSVEIR